MIVEVRITLSGYHDRTLEAIEAALEPDNVNFPEGIKVRTWRRGSNITLVVDSATELETLLSTVEDLLASVRLSLDALEGSV